MALRVAFFGTPRFAVPTLVEIVGQGHAHGVAVLDTMGQEHLARLRPPAEIRVTA